MNDDATSTVILPALSKVEGSERSLPAVVGESKDLYLPRLAPFSPKRVSHPCAPFPCSRLTMNDNPTNTVILSERSESKDLYLPRLPRLPADARGLRSRPLWSATVRAALHSCRLSMPLGHSGSGIAASVRRSPHVMSDYSASAVILPALSKVEGSEHSLPAVAGESKDLYLPRLAPPSPNQDSRGDASIPYSLFSN